MEFTEELFLDHGILISEEEWHKRIEILRNETKDAKGGEPFFTAIDTERKNLHDILVSAIKRRLEAHQGERIGLFFSGGLDSSFIAAICKSLGHDVLCVTVGFQDTETNTQVPLDIRAAGNVALALGLNFVQRIYDYDAAEAIIKKTCLLLRPHANPINAAVGSVVVAAAEFAKTHGVTVLFSGLGSEEIYAGYERHAKSEDVHEECWYGLKQMYSRDLIRDCTLAEKLGITVLTPFLDPAVILQSMKFPPRTKLNIEGSKLILREIAKPYLGEHALRKKKAAQYGSAFQKALEKVARKDGVTIKEYIGRLNASVQ